EPRVAGRTSRTPQRIARMSVAGVRSGVTSTYSTSGWRCASFSRASNAAGSVDSATTRSGRLPLTSTLTSCSAASTHATSPWPASARAARHCATCAGDGETILIFIGSAGASWDSGDAVLSAGRVVGAGEQLARDRGREGRQRRREVDERDEGLLRVAGE